MSLEIFWASGSPYAWRVMLALELKRVPYEAKLLEFSKGQTRTPEFLALNPRGKVPVLRDGDLVLAESTAILTYLDRKFPDPPLFGRTAEETGRIWSAISEFDSYMRDPLAAIHRWVFGGDKPRTPEVDEAHGKVMAELARLETRIGSGPWLVPSGDAPTAADVVWFPGMRTIIRGGVRAEPRARELGLFPFVERFPNIGAWIARVEALPGYDNTFPTHWR